MLDFDSIVEGVVSEASGGMSKSASRNRYEWEVSAGLKSGTRVRLSDGRSGELTAPFPGCRGDGEWCGVFLDDGTEENIRPAQVAATFDKAAGWRPHGRTAAEADVGRTVTYTVEFANHGTDRMSAVVKKQDGGVTETSSSREHKSAADLLASLVEFEANASGPPAKPEPEPSPPEGVPTPGGA